MPLLTDGVYSRKIFDSVSCGISIVDARQPDMPLVYVNPAFERMTGYAAEEVYGRNCRFLQRGDTEQPDRNRMRAAIQNRRDERILLKNYRKDGTLFWNELYLSPIFDDAGELTHFAGIQNDVTAQVLATQQLEQLAHYDMLTGLANRKLLMEHLKLALLRARRSRNGVAVLFFDMDNFKSVNDVYGHEAGDTLLQLVGERMRAAVRAEETVARLGGDEFVVVLEYVSGGRQPAEIVQRFTAKICEPVELGMGQVFTPDVSVGIALYPADGETSEELLRVADQNMYAAKHESRMLSQYEADDESKHS